MLVAVEVVVVTFPVAQVEPVAVEPVARQVQLTAYQEQQILVVVAAVDTI